MSGGCARSCVDDVWIKFNPNSILTRPATFPRHLSSISQAAAVSYHKYHRLHFPLRLFRVLRGLILEHLSRVVLEPQLPAAQQRLCAKLTPPSHPPPVMPVSMVPVPSPPHSAHLARPSRSSSLPGNGRAQETIGGTSASKQTPRARGRSSKPFVAWISGWIIGILGSGVNVRQRNLCRGRDRTESSPARPVRQPGSAPVALQPGPLNLLPPERPLLRGDFFAGCA